jgi:NDP-sugar pyrophosphorylase family protein
LTEDRTKPAIPFLNHPLIAYAVEYLASHGIRDVIVNLHHQPDSIRRALGDGSAFGSRIEYSFEQEILGTSGAIDRVRDRLIDDDFVVINGKIITDIDLDAAISAHRGEQALATLVLRENAAREHFSIVEVDERGRITRFAGFPEPVASAMDATESAPNASATSTRAEGSPLMFTGIQVLSPRIFDYVPRDCFSHSTIHVYPRAIEAGEALLGYISSGNWYEMSTLDRYLEASLLFMDKQGLSLVTGSGCHVAGDATVEESVLWDQVTVESGARVRRAVLGEGVLVPAGTEIENAVVVRREIIREIERGTISGDNLLVPIK